MLKTAPVSAVNTLNPRHESYHTLQHQSSALFILVLFLGHFLVSTGVV